MRSLIILSIRENDSLSLSCSNSPRVLTRRLPRWSILSGCDAGSLLSLIISRKTLTTSSGFNTLSATFISFIYIFLRLTVLNFANTLNFYQTGNIYSQNLSVRFYTFTKVFFEYLSLIFYPKELMIARSATVITSITDLYILSFILLFILGLFLSIKFYKKDPLYLFSFAWFFITILPVSGIIPINNIMAEHYLYLPSLSFFLLIAKLFTFLWQKFPGHTQRLVISLLIIAIITTLSGRTIIRTFDWRNPIIFYTKSLAQSPENLPMRNNLAMAYSERNMLEEAIREYKATIEIGDIYPNTHHNLANVYKQQGKCGKLQKSIQYDVEICKKMQALIKTT